MTDRTRSPDRMVIDIAVRLGLIALMAFWTLQIIGPFVMVVAWGVILTVATYPFYVWLTARLGGRGKLASALITVAGLAVILGPTAALAVSLFESVHVLAGNLSGGALKLPVLPEHIRDWPLVGAKLQEIWDLATSNLRAVLADNASMLLGLGEALLKRIAGLGGSVLLMAASVVISGFLFRPGPALAHGAGRFATRLAGPRGAAFVTMAGTTIRNVSRGVIGISMLQALLAGIGLMVAGVPGAGPIAMATLVLGIVQIGPGLVLIPAIIWAWVNMNTGGAALFTLYMAPVLFMDNALKPMVMARGLETPMLVIFIGVLGGTLTHGLLGLFLGPIVLAVAYDLLLAWAEDPDAKTPDDAPPAA